MCTVVLTFDPHDPMPLRLLGVRDELASRPWRPPAGHWPGSPLIGGIDEEAGGTWLALHPAVPRVACLLNGRGEKADSGRRRSRGELPLRAAADGPQALENLSLDPRALAVYDPFILIVAETASVSVLSWHGEPPRTDGYLPGGRPPVPPGRVRTLAFTHPAVRHLDPGTHLFTNAGHAYPAGPGDPADDQKAAHFAEKFAAARPSAGPARPLAQAWGDWLTLADGDGVDPADPAALLVRRNLPDGQLYATTSMSLVALGPDGIRYDFQPEPGRIASWSPVALDT